MLVCLFSTYYVEICFIGKIVDLNYIQFCDKTTVNPRSPQGATGDSAIINLKKYMSVIRLICLVNFFLNMYIPALVALQCARGEKRHRNTSDWLYNRKLEHLKKNYISIVTA